jgi:Protein of unknown function (DUF2793)
MTGTARLQLPLLSTGQAQKEVTVNEALQALDVFTGGSVEEGPRQDPPASPAVGSCYVIGSAPTGEWAGKAGYVAAFTIGGWRLYPPTDGVSLYNKADSHWISFRAGAWEQGIVRGSSLFLGGQQVVGNQAVAIPDPAAGAVVDAEARSAVTEILQAMRHHGLIAI